VKPTTGSRHFKIVAAKKLVLGLTNIAFSPLALPPKRGPKSHPVYTLLHLVSVCTHLSNKNKAISVTLQHEEA
jgi:hypothetical protein